MGKPRMLGLPSKPIKNKDRRANPFGKKKRGKRNV